MFTARIPLTCIGIHPFCYVAILFILVLLGRSPARADHVRFSLASWKMTLLLWGGVMTGCAFLGSLWGTFRMVSCCWVDFVRLTCCGFGLWWTGSWMKILILECCCSISSVGQAFPVFTDIAPTKVFGQLTVPSVACFSCHWAFSIAFLVFLHGVFR